MHPGINPITWPIDAAQAAVNLETSPETKIPAEPELRCYTLASCASTQAVKKKAKCKKRKRHARKRKKACRHKKHRRH